MEHAVVNADGVDSEASENAASQQDTVLDDAIEFFSIRKNCHKDHSIEPIEPYKTAWENLPSLNSVEYCGDVYRVGGVIKVVISGEKENSFAKIRDIKSLGDGRHVLHLFWYYEREEMRRFAGRRNIRWPTGNTHMRTTHMEVVMWDSANGKVSAEELNMLSPGKIFDLSCKSVRDETHKLVAWASPPG